MKKIAFLCTLLVLCCGMAVPVGAYTNTTDELLVTEKDILHVDTIFNGDAIVVDSAGTDVTKDFKSRNDKNYLNKEYGSILDDLIDNDLAIEENDAIEDKIVSDHSQNKFISPARVVVNGSVTSGTVTRYFTSSVTGGTTREWIKFNFTGYFQYNDYNNTITDWTRIKVNVVEQSSSTLTKDCVITGHTQTISANNKTIQFDVSYTARLFGPSASSALGVLLDTKSGTKEFSKTLS